MAAMLKIETPESCVKCKVAVWCPSDFGDHRICGLVGLSIDRYAESCHPDCPLEIVPETPEGELKPCPFCGEPKADGVTEIIPGYPYESTPRYEIVCWKCFGRVPDYDTSVEAIAAWNRREG